MNKLQNSSDDKLPRYIQVNSTLEFSRLVCALERAPRVSFLHDYEGQKILSVQMDILKEKPIVYYTPLEHVGHYLCYGLKKGKEESKIVDTTSDASKLYSPIIKIFFSVSPKLFSVTGEIPAKAINIPSVLCVSA